MSGEGVIASAPVDWNQPFALGPVRVDPDADAARAKVVREALTVATRDDPSPDVAHYGRWVANNASDATLAKLGRLLK